VVTSIVYNTEEDCLIWAYESKGEYSSKSLYAIINFRGVQPMFVPAVWKVIVPPRIQVFLWLPANNKIMTTDNLLKRGISHLNVNSAMNMNLCSIFFFYCVVAKYMWNLVYNFSGLETFRLPGVGTSNGGLCHKVGVEIEYLKGLWTLPGQETALRHIVKPG
jgi:hypothetical protein